MRVKTKFLLIGPLPLRVSDIGGASLLFKEMVDYFELKKFNYKIIPSNSNKNKLLSFVCIFRNIIKYIKYKEVIINLSQNGIIYLYPFLFIAFKALNFNINVRFFGAHAYDLIDKAKHKKLLFYFLKKSNNFFVETKHLVDIFQKKGITAKWFPNVRKTKSNSLLNRSKKKYKKKFLFLGHIKRSKGIIELLEVFEELGEDYSLEIYGHIQEKELSFIENHKFYKGFVKYDEINKLYEDNDVLVLPTYYPGEGYPGVIIEAYVNSLPVITTNWRFIPEIVDNGQSGILINPKSKKELRQAILFFNKNNYHQMSKKSFLKSHEFNSVKVHETVVLELLRS